MDTRQKIRDFIVENFLYGSDDGFGDDESFREKGLIDSTGILELIAFLEEQFGIRIEDDEIIPENLDSIASLVPFVEAKKRGEHGKRLESTLYSLYTAEDASS